MKTWLVCVVFLMALNLFGAGTNAPPSPPSTAGRALSLETQKQGTTTTSYIVREPKPNEIIRGKLTFEGIAVEAIKTRRPLQLLNPVAPARYGSPEDNVARDPINGRASGLKLFAIRF